MRRLLNAAFLTLPLLMPVLALSQQPARIEWQPPDAFEDGTPLLQAEHLEAYRMYCRRDGQPLTDPYVIPVTGDEIEHVASKEDLLGAFGTYTCVMTAVAHSGLESAYSNDIELTWDPAPRRMSSSSSNSHTSSSRSHSQPPNAKQATAVSSVTVCGSKSMPAPRRPGLKPGARQPLKR